ncbi:MAG: MBL fold metallo-hydrolase [Thermoplasmata archaeon]
MEIVKLGDVGISRVVELEGPMMAPSELFPDVGSEDLALHRDWLSPLFLDPDDILILSVHTYVVRTRQHIILVDTGVGRGKDQGTESRYLRGLLDAGVSPEKVDFIVNTHFHIDHVGWNTRWSDGKLVPTFPRAEYLFVREEWDYWRGVTDPRLGSEPIQESVTPIMESGKARVVEGDFVIDEDTRLEPIPGHTPGHVAVHVESGGKEAILVGDMFHHPVQVAEPGWRNALDEINGDPTEAREVREAFLERYADRDTMILPAHFAYPTAGYIISKDRAFRWRPTAA